MDSMSSKLVITVLINKPCSRFKWLALVFVSGAERKDIFSSLH